MYSRAFKLSVYFKMDLITFNFLNEKHDMTFRLP